MITHEINGLKLLKFEGLAGIAGLEHAVSTRPGGVSPVPYSSLNLGPGSGDLPENAAVNLRRFCAAARVPFGRMVRMHQRHTSNVRVIGPDFRFPADAPAVLSEADALMTNIKEVPLLALSADCALTVFYDPVRSVLAVSHSGWRGAALNIYAQVIAVMKLRFGSNPGDLIVGVAPMISADHYPVKEDLLAKIRMFYPEDVLKKCFLLREGRHHFSLKELLKHQLVSLGVVKYEFAHLCTYSEKDLFYSWRRDGEHTGRFGLLAMLR